MQTVSTPYRKEMQKRLLGKADCRISLGIVDTDAAATATAHAPHESVYSNCTAMMTSLSVPVKTYASFEPGRLKLDGSALVPPLQTSGMPLLPEGYLSAECSGADGTFAAPPCITLTFTKRHTVPGLQFTFDAVANEKIAQMRVRAWREEVILCDKMISPDAVCFCFRQELTRFDRLELTFLKTDRPHRRARLQQLVFGEGILFTAKNLRSVTQKQEIDPIMRRLSNGSVRFSAINRNTLTGTENALYNPDNPLGVWRFVERHSPVQVQFGQLLTGGLSWGDVAGQNWSALALAAWGALTKGGYTEWINAGRYYLTAKPSVDGMFAEFAAEDALSLLTGTYSKGVYAAQEKTLYALATDVLTAAPLPQITPSETPWRLWEGLKNIKTTAPLPILSQRECLQLIAHAGCCALYCDRAGNVCILPPPTKDSGVMLDFGLQRAEPCVEKIDTLAAVICPAIAYAPEEKQTELHKASYAVQGTLHLHVTYSAAAEITATVTGATVAAFTPYAAAADITLTGNGTAQLLIAGKKLTSATMEVTAAVANADENGAVEHIKNALITTPQHAEKVAAWVRDYLLLRTTYTLQTAGNPELEPLDLLHAETLFAPTSAMRLLANEVMFDGSLAGKLILKRRDEYAI
ncbi:MAG: hypothetical protein RR989_03330 [Ruthenibacterium sp.]